MQSDIGKLILRLTVGVLLIFHGIHKLLHGIGPITGMLAAHHVSGIVAYGVYLGEIVGPVLVIVGLLARLGGFLIVVNMIVAVLLAGLPRLFAFGPQGGYALELEAFFLFGGLAIAFLGAGRISLGRGRWN